MILVTYHIVGAYYGAAQVFNTDETLITVSKGGVARLLRLTRSNYKAVSKKLKRLNTIGSYTPFVNAAGEVLLEVICIKAVEGSKVQFNVPLEKVEEKKKRPSVRLVP